MSSERAGTPTHGTLNREKFVELLMDKHIPVDDVLDALEACVVPDPRLARIEALLEESEAATEEYGRRQNERTGYPDRHEAMLFASQVRAILRGDQ